MKGELVRKRVPSTRMIRSTYADLATLTARELRTVVPQSMPSLQTTQLVRAQAGWAPDRWVATRSLLLPQLCVIFKTSYCNATAVESGLALNPALPEEIHKGKPARLWASRSRLSLFLQMLLHFAQHSSSKHFVLSFTFIALARVPRRRLLLISIA